MFKNILLILCNLYLVLGDIVILTPENKTVELLIAYKITYTPGIPEAGIIGLLVQADPPDACSAIAPPPKSPAQSNHSGPVTWFALAYRSSSFHSRCSNREKIQHAANAGYKALILYSPNDYFHSSINHHAPIEQFSNYSIPAVIVSHDDGEALRVRYSYFTGFKIMITSDIPQNLSYFLLPFAIVIGVGLLIIISYIVFQMMMCIQERRKAQRYRLSKKYLKKLTLQKYEKGIYYETCAICLEDYVEGEKIRILPCNHAYHMKCIDPWLTKNRRVCPVCKAKVKLPGMEEFTDSESDADRRNQEEDANERSQLLPARRTRRPERWPPRGHLSILIDTNSTSTSHPSTSASTSYQSGPLDDSLFQPGPSTSSAPPVVSELTSTDRRKSKRRSRRSTRTVQVVAAEIAPLIAPPQLSINCDSETERPLTPQPSTSQPSTSSASDSRRPNRATSSVDQIV